MNFFFLTQKDEDVLFMVIRQAQCMKPHLTETHGHNFEVHNIALSSQSVSLSSKLPSPNTSNPNYPIRPD